MAENLHTLKMDFSILKPQMYSETIQDLRQFKTRIDDILKAKFGPSIQTRLIVENLEAPEWDFPETATDNAVKGKFSDCLLIKEIDGHKYLILKKTTQSPGGFTAFEDVPKNDDLHIRFIDNGQ